jgi:hypothetical protein
LQIETCGWLAAGWLCSGCGGRSSRRTALVAHCSRTVAPAATSLQRQGVASGSKVEGSRSVEPWVCSGSSQSSSSSLDCSGAAWRGGGVISMRRRAAAGSCAAICSSQIAESSLAMAMFSMFSCAMVRLTRIMSMCVKRSVRAAAASALRAASSIALLKRFLTYLPALRLQTARSRPCACH